MTTIDVTNQNTSLQDLLRLAQAEDGVVLIQSGQPVAKILPLVAMPHKRLAPLHPGAWEVGADFDTPLAEDILLGKQ